MTRFFAFSHRITRRAEHIRPVLFCRYPASDIEHILSYFFLSYPVHLTRPIYYIVVRWLQHLLHGHCRWRNERSYISRHMCAQYLQIIITRKYSYLCWPPFGRLIKKPARSYVGWNCRAQSNDIILVTRKGRHTRNLPLSQSNQYRRTTLKIKKNKNYFHTPVPAQILKKKKKIVNVVSVAKPGGECRWTVVCELIE